MTPKEKAISIFNEYDEWWWYVNYLIKHIESKEGKEYWEEVKREIEKHNQSISKYDYGIGFKD